MRSIQTNRDVTISKNYSELIDAGARQILEASQRAIEEKGIFHFAMAGGIAARGIYTTMASKNFRDEFDWDRIHFYWTDERWVLPDHARSNYGLVAEVLLTQVDIPIENLHPIRTNAKTAEISAICYEETIRARLIREEGEVPKFDLIMLELGKSGNIASIFPDHEAVVEKTRLVIPVRDDDLYEDRVSMTLPLINHAEEVLMLASGRERSTTLKKVLEGSFNEDALPAQLVSPHSGSLSWFVDAHAAVELEGNL